MFIKTIHRLVKQQYTRFFHYCLSKPQSLAHIILVTVRNSCAENPFDKYGNLISTKESPAKHGYGIKSIERVVKKYNGNMSMYFDDETSTFHTNILFYKDFIPNWHNEHSALPLEN